VVTFYPATGLRYPTSGAIVDTDYSGRAWSVAISGTNAYYLVFTSANVYPTGSNVRAYSFPVRCVQYLFLLE
jgi:hypothetical protein